MVVLEAVDDNGVSMDLSRHHLITFGLFASPYLKHRTGLKPTASNTEMLTADR